jgi:superfamily II RNA helicase
MTDHAMLGFFLRENDAWEDVITRRGREIPDLERMLEERMADLRTMPAGVRANLECLHEGMERQRAELRTLQRALQEQQRFLAKGREAEAADDGIHSLSRQNLLRERIRSAERNFIELKCDFLNQLSAVY